MPLVDYLLLLVQLWSIVVRMEVLLISLVHDVPQSSTLSNCMFSKRTKARLALALIKRDNRGQVSLIPEQRVIGSIHSHYLSSLLELNMTVLSLPF